MEIPRVLTAKIILYLMPLLLSQPFASIFSFRLLSNLILVAPPYCIFFLCPLLVLFGIRRCYFQILCLIMFVRFFSFIIVQPFEDPKTIRGRGLLCAFSPQSLGISAKKFSFTSL